MVQYSIRNKSSETREELRLLVKKLCGIHNLTAEQLIFNVLTDYDRIMLDLQKIIWELRREEKDNIYSPSEQHRTEIIKERIEKILEVE